MVTNLLHKPLFHRLGALGRLPQPARKAIQEADRGAGSCTVMRSRSATTTGSALLRYQVSQRLVEQVSPRLSVRNPFSATGSESGRCDGRGGMLKSGIRKFEVCGVWTKTERGRQHVDAEISGWAPGERRRLRRMILISKRRSLVRSGNRVGLFNLLLVTRTNTMRGEKAPDSPPLPTFNPPPTRRALAFEDNRQRHERGWRTWIGRIVAKLTEASSVPSDGMAGESESVSLGGRFREDAGAPSLMSR